MPNIKPLSLEALQQNIKHLESLEKASIEEQRQGALQHYAFVASQGGDRYAEMASRIVRNEGFDGKLVNNFTAQRAKEANIAFTECNRSKLARDIAYSDAVTREKNLGNPITKKAIIKFHEERFEDAGLPKDAWIGTVFKDAVGEEGSSIIFDSQGFFKSVTQTGSEHHREFIRLLKTVEGDVLYKTLREAPIVESAQFLGTAFSTVKDAELQDILKLGAQSWTRGLWENCFTSLKESRGAWYRTDPLPSFNQLLVQALRESPFKTPMPSGLQAFVVSDGRNVLSQPLSGSP